MSLRYMFGISILLVTQDESFTKRSIEDRVKCCEAETFCSFFLFPHAKVCAILRPESIQKPAEVARVQPQVSFPAVLQNKVRTSIPFKIQRRFVSI